MYKNNLHTIIHVIIHNESTLHYNYIHISYHVVDRIAIHHQLRLSLLLLNRVVAIIKLTPNRARYLIA